MIVAISAAPRWDTTGIAVALANKHAIGVLEDPSKKRVTDLGFQTLYDMPASLQRQVRESLILDHLKTLSESPGCVLNYSVFPWLADWMRWFWGSTPSEAWEQVMHQAAQIVKRYDVIYHVESGQPRPYDGYAWLDKRNSTQQNSLLKLLYTELGVAAKVKAWTGNS